MHDRVPTRVNRVQIIREGTGETFFATITMADEPYLLGTPYNKVSVLPDDVALALGLNPASDPTLADALRAIASRL